LLCIALNYLHIVQAKKPSNKKRPFSGYVEKILHVKRIFDHTTSQTFPKSKEKPIPIIVKPGAYRFGHRKMK
tara:strand:- start:3133 stop:3348 length:216 start_codon:yes stop_codon:yes gene_type:complete